MSAGPKIVVDPVAVHVRLRGLDLVAEELTSSLLAGASAMALTSSEDTNYPPIFGGISFWAEAVKTLRDKKRAQKWTRSDARNYSTVVNQDRTMQIAIARGDEWTGRHEAPPGKPSTLHKKGTATQLAVEVNHQYSLFSLFDEVPTTEDDDGAIETPIVTWVLLHYREKNKIRCELSHPTAISKAGYVEEWAERIILGEIDLEPNRISLPDEPPVAPDVFVRRRA